MRSAWPLSSHPPSGEWENPGCRALLAGGEGGCRRRQPPGLLRSGAQRSPRPSLTRPPCRPGRPLLRVAPTTGGRATTAGVRGRQPPRLSCVDAAAGRRARSRLRAASAARRRRRRPDACAVTAAVAVAIPSAGRGRGVGGAPRAESGGASGQHQLLRCALHCGRAERVARGRLRAARRLRRDAPHEPVWLPPGRGAARRVGRRGRPRRVQGAARVPHAPVGVAARGGGRGHTAGRGIRAV